MCDINVEADKTYAVTAVADTKESFLDVYAIITVYRNDGSMIIREHIADVEGGEGQLCFSDRIKIDKDGCKLRIELWLKGYNGAVKWHDIKAAECEPIKPRIVRIALAYLRQPWLQTRTLEQNKSEILEVIDNCGEYNPDIMVLSETMYRRGIPSVNLRAGAQTENGEMCTLLRKKAIRYNSYIVYNFHEIDGTKFYNISILIGRNGETVGKYRKTHLTLGKYEIGITPGNDYPVFDTDFGGVGLLICFDQYFSATAEALAANGAELILTSSAGILRKYFRQEQCIPVCMLLCAD